MKPCVPSSHWTADHERYGLWFGASIIDWCISPFVAIAIARAHAKRTGQTVTITKTDRSRFMQPGDTIDILTVQGR